MERDQYGLGGFFFLRALGAIHLVAFASLWVQIAGLIGARGILPLGPFLELVKEKLGAAAYVELPTVFWLGSSDGALELVCVAGMAVALMLIAGVLEAASLVVLWVLYLSVSVGARTFLGYQWDILLIEVTFAAIWISHAGFWAPFAGALSDPPAKSGVRLLRLIGFKLVFSSGVMKYRSGDPTWRNLTALDYHYETQPLPTWVGWFAHQLPEAAQKLSVLSMFFIQLVVPFFLFAPERRIRLAGCAVLILLQVLIALTGNYGFFNWLALALCLLAVDDAAFGRILPRKLVARASEAVVRPRGSRAGRALRGIAIAGLVALNALQLMRTTFGSDALSDRAEQLLAIAAGYRTVGSYGLFAVMTTTRNEIIVEGSDDGVCWKAYELEYKPGDPGRRPRFVAPHQPRLDWQMWFAALGTARQSPWFRSFVGRLLEGSPEVLGLLRENPFPSAPPKMIRAELFKYHFSSFEERFRDGVWWRREPAGVYFPPTALEADAERTKPLPGARSSGDVERRDRNLEDEAMPSIVYLVKDLIFSSKIREVAGQVGVSVEPFRDPKALAAAARDAKLVIMDLRLPEALEALDLIAQNPGAEPALSVGFIDHERTDVMDLAAKKGCKKVLAKGRFTSELPSLVASIAP